MIKSSIISISIAALLFLAGCNSESSDSTTTNSASKPAEAAQATETTTGGDVETCKTLGEYFAISAGLGDLSFTEAETAAIVEGFQKGLSGGSSMEEMQAKIGVVRNFIQTKHAEKAAVDREINQKAAAEFVAKLKENPEVKFTESGLGYVIKKEGEGEKPTMSDSVAVNYKGTLIDGTEFDSATDPEQPVTFPLAGVIPGFSEGLQLVGKGGEITLYIPSNLGYGDNPRPGSPIKAGAMLVFDITIQDVKQPKASTPDLPPPPPPPPAEDE